MHNDKIAETLKPDVSELTREYHRAHTDERITNRIKEADETRYAVWDGQSEDGKKHGNKIGKAAFPWEGANDTRIRLADEVCQYHSALLGQAATRAELEVNPTEASDIEIASAAEVYMRWVAQALLYPELLDEIELHGEYGSQYGWSMLHIYWERTRAQTPKVVSLAQLKPILEQLTGDENINPVEFLDQNSDLLSDVLRAAVPGYKQSDIKKFLKELKDTGKGTVITTEVARNQPKIVALRPYHEILFPPETTDIQRARCIMRREFHTVAEIEQFQDSDGWDAEFVEQAKKTVGRSSQVWDNARSPAIGPGYRIEDNSNLIEIIYAYSRKLNEKGIPGIYLTIFSPTLNKHSKNDDLYAKHTLVTGVGDTYPFQLYTREKTRRSPVESRGIPEIIKTWQNEYKAQADAQFDNTSLTTLPPLLKPTRYGQHLKLGPAAQIPEQRQGDIRWLNPPSQIGVENSKLVQEEIRLRIASYFGRPHGGVAPTETTLRQQQAVDRWTRHLTCVYRSIWELVQQFGEEEEFQRVTGLGIPLPRDRKRYDFQVSFDVKDLDPEFLDKKLTAVSKFVLPTDSGGVIDRNKLTLLQLRAIDPSLPRQIAMDAGPASKKLYEEVNGQVVSMALGNEATYTESDPAAAMKLQMLQSIVQSNPKYLQMLSEEDFPGRTVAPDPRFQELLRKYAENLQMSITQDQNKQVGRLGVQTNQPAMFN